MTVAWLLQSSRTEQVARFVVSTLIVVIQIVISTVFVTAGMVLLTQTTVDMNDEGLGFTKASGAPRASHLVTPARSGPALRPQ